MQNKVKFQQMRSAAKHVLSLAAFTALLALLQLGFSLGCINTETSWFSPSAIAAPAAAKVKAPADAKVKAKGEWVDMPEGGRPAFVGVQGGTVPATVLAKDAANPGFQQREQLITLVDVLLTAFHFAPQIGLGVQPESVLV